MSSELPLVEIMFLDPGICEPGTAQLRSHFKSSEAKGGYCISYHPPTGLITLMRELNGKLETRSAHVSRAREMVVGDPKPLPQPPTKPVK